MSFNYSHFSHAVSYVTHNYSQFVVVVVVTLHKKVVQEMFEKMPH